MTEFKRFLCTMIPSDHLPLQWSFPTRDKLRTGPLSLIQWRLSTRDKLVLCPLYSGASLQGTSWSFVPYTVAPLYKGQVGPLSLIHIQWSLSTRDKLGMTVAPLYKGQVGPLSLIQWRLSTRDKLVLCPLYSGASLQGTSWSFVPYTVEPLYKGQVGTLSLIHTVEKGQVVGRSFYAVEPLQVGDRSYVPYTVEPLYKGQVE